jgi:Transglutaminase-like superfamily
VRLLLGLIIIALDFGTASSASANSTHWYKIVTPDGQKIGFGRQDISETNANRTITEIREIFVKEGDSRTKRIVETFTRSEDEMGRTRLLRHHSIVGKSISEISAVIENGQAKIMRWTGFDRQSLTLPLPAGIQFDNGDALLQHWDFAKTPKLEYLNFSLTAQTVEQVTVEVIPTKVPDPDGNIRIVRKSFDGDDLRQVAVIALDQKRKPVAAGQQFFGTEMTIEPTDEATALAKAKPFSMVHATLAKSPYRISKIATQGHIRFVYKYKDGVTFPLPQTGEQRVTVTGNQARIDICDRCGPTFSLSDETLEDARKATIWMQSNDPLLRSIADPIKAMPVSGIEKMLRLAKQARRWIKNVDYSGHFSAVEALRRRAGDCTEDAVTLAALGRAAGIPTKVASGLVYYREKYHGVSNVFMPHSWTVAWIDGNWRSFDMSLDGFDATHIALTIGDGDTRSIFAAGQLANLMQLETMTEVRSPAAGE